MGKDTTLNQNCNLSAQNSTVTLLKKRNKLKFFSYHITGLLYYQNPDSSLRKSYKNTFYCADTMQAKDGKLTSMYCKNRWCQTCQRNKMGLMIQTYAPRLKECPDLYFVTLTRPNVPNEQLKGEIKELYTLFRSVMTSRYFRTYTKSGKIGMRKIECTYNPQRDDYHPHFHILIEGKEVAEKMVSEWLRLNPSATSTAQNIRQVSELRGGVLEIFKYFTKLFAKDNSGKCFFDAPHMNNIFVAMSGTRVYQRLGTKEAWRCDEVNEDEEAELATIPYDGPDGDFFRYIERQDYFGYYSIETGEVLVELPVLESYKKIISNSEQAER